ncbi:L-threonine 3-dehydrogenase [Halodesulfurarchaeum formicicum]|uniref:L-threonine 3-dehydrogenase n=1 Tax=Halodesulfurarchaeum formicicum TaxID=1873524 RepID=A0A1D8S657_9EURY|nr:NAD-dependent epimerase/dehydratase family protein [Halodesulfurarchaeum formicicum]AOW80841.1 L-threonine 3-dehydrogenase [Halodesulfurarchaeum formicicum]
MQNVLVTGARGQIGSELIPALRARDDVETVVATDIEEPDDDGGSTEEIDVRDAEAFAAALSEYDVDTVFHLAAILSARGEDHPQLAFEVNIEGFHNVLEAGREHGLDRLVVPSSIAVFGPETPTNPGEMTTLAPRTIYGISKVFGEHMGNYYSWNYDLDVRGVRLPGIISHKTLPGGGTTDYAVEVFYDAIEEGEYTYFVREDTELPMMYMQDAIRALIGIATADRESLEYPCSYNVGALSFTAGELTAAIQEHLPDFEAHYEPDERQDIADSWPDAVDDSAAREDWGWEHTYDLETMTADMLEHLEKKLG